MTKAQYPTFFFWGGGGQAMMSCRSLLIRKHSGNTSESRISCLVLKCGAAADITLSNLLSKFAKRKVTVPSCPWFGAGGGGGLPRPKAGLKAEANPHAGCNGALLGRW